MILTVIDYIPPQDIYLTKSSTKVLQRIKALKTCYVNKYFTMSNVVLPKYKIICQVISQEICVSG